MICSAASPAQSSSIHSLFMSWSSFTHAGETKHKDIQIPPNSHHTITACQQDKKHDTSNFSDPNAAKDLTPSEKSAGLRPDNHLLCASGLQRGIPPGPVVCRGVCATSCAFWTWLCLTPPEYAWHKSQAGNTAVAPTRSSPLASSRGSIRTAYARQSSPMETTPMTFTRAQSTGFKIRRTVRIQ